MNHARAFDLPGWPTPPRVRDIAKTAGSWGWVMITDIGAFNPAVVQDEVGYLWADGDAVPSYRKCNESTENPGGYLFWTEGGLGVYIHPKSYARLFSKSRLDMQATETDRWIPIAVVAQSVPEFAR